MTQPDFISGLIAQGSGQSSQSFATGAPSSSKTPDPARQGFSQNVAGGTVNVGSTAQTFGVTHHDDGRPEVSTFTSNTPTSVSVDQAALALFGMSKGPNGQVAQLQQRLYDAGYLSRIKTPGIPDDDTARAYGSMLQQVSASNMAGDPITVEQYLQESAAAAKAAGTVGGGAGVANGMRLQTSNPLDVAQTAQQVAQSELGRKLKPKELNAFLSVYHGIEASKNSQTAASDPTIQAGGNVTSVAAPSVSAAADNYMQTQFAPEYGAANVASTFDAFRKLIS